MLVHLSISSPAVGHPGGLQFGAIMGQAAKPFLGRCLYELQFPFLLGGCSGAAAPGPQ